MKQSLLFLSALLIALGSSSSAQVVTVTTGLSGPWGLAVDGTTMYIAERNGDKISTLDLDAPELGVTDFITGINAPSDLTIVGSKLYMGERIGTDILEMDLSSPSPAIVTTSTNYITGFEMVGDEMYYCRNGGDSVYVADVSGGIPTTSGEYVGDIDQGYGIAVHGTDMYVADDGAGKVLLVDMTAGTPAPVDFKNYPNSTGLTVYNDFLYVSTFDVSAGAIYQINLITDDVDLIALSLSGPLCFEIYNDELYFSEFSADQISKISLGVGVEEDASEANLIYPNPTSESVYVIGASEGDSYEIYDLKGTLVASGAVDALQQIDVVELSKGSYSLKLEGAKAVTFLKD